MRPFFGWVNLDIVKQTIDQTTQWGVALDSFPMKRHLKSRNPALNFPRRHEPVATDTIFSDTPEVDSGVKQAQVFVGRDSLVADVYPMKSGKQFVNTLADNIRRRGAMDKLLSDSAKTEISKKVMDILRAYHISNWHSEPYHQNQNPADWQYRTIKYWTNTVMNMSGAPANCWLLCMIYVCYILNHIACGALNGSIPLLVLYGITPDISIMLLYTFYQPVFYATHDQHFPSESEERAAFWVGFGEHCGDAMTHKLLDKITQKIIYTQLYIVAGPEFEDWEGYILTFSKALYGLKSSGKRWAETLHDILKDMNFTPSRADQCIWLKKNNKLNLYEYIAVYVDDLCIAAQDPKEIINTLKSKYNLKVKGDGPLTYHLGADYFQDPDGTLVFQPKIYIEKLKETYVRFRNTEPSKVLKTHLEKNDHPELDTSEILEGHEVNHYLTMVGQLQWLKTLGRFDIQAQVITMSRFQAQPRQGHLERLKRIYAYVIRTKDYATRFRTTEPDYSYLPDQNFDWAHTIYGHVQEIIPDDIPDPLGKSKTTNTAVDANLNHCLATGRSVTGCLHFVNHTPIESFSKRQAAVETVTEIHPS